MSDYGLFLDTDGLIDIAFVPGDVAADDGLETAILISLFSDARASDELIEALDKDGDLRGYWGDFETEDQTGSLIWTVKRAKQLQRVLAQVRSYAMNSLQWLIDDKVAESVVVNTSYPAIGWMLIEVFIYRPGSKNPVSYRYNYQWNAQQIKAVS